jgi:hypothetical protein
MKKMVLCESQAPYTLTVDEETFLISVSLPDSLHATQHHEPKQGRERDAPVPHPWSSSCALQQLKDRLQAGQWIVVSG